MDRTGELSSLITPSFLSNENLDTLKFEQWSQNKRHFIFFSNVKYRKINELPKSEKKVIKLKFTNDQLWGLVGGPSFLNMRFLLFVALHARSRLLFHGIYF